MRLSPPLLPRPIPAAGGVGVRGDEDGEGRRRLLLLRRPAVLVLPVRAVLQGLPGRGGMLRRRGGGGGGVRGHVLRGVWEGGGTRGSPDVAFVVCIFLE